MTATNPKQNPHACSDGGCVLLVPGVPVGMRTNGGCRCIGQRMGPDERVRVRGGIRWLAERAALVLLSGCLSIEPGLDYSLVPVSSPSPTTDEYPAAPADLGTMYQQVSLDWFCARAASCGGIDCEDLADHPDWQIAGQCLQPHAWDCLDDMAAADTCDTIWVDCLPAYATEVCDA